MHYYEDGNVQLVSSKEVKKSIDVSVSSTEELKIIIWATAWENVRLWHMGTSEA